jgi:hypothetical protein
MVDRKSMAPVLAELAEWPTRRKRPDAEIEFVGDGRPGPKPRPPLAAEADPL